MSNPLKIDEITRTDDRAAVISMAGELDLATAPELYSRAATSLETRPILILDMSGITFCDSSGFNALIRLRRRAEEAHGRLILAAPPDQVLRLLALSGAESIFHVYAGLDEARAALPGTTGDAG
jgi:anti-sigma B factor antagonist